MKLPKNLALRGNVFYARVAVPKSLLDLRAAVAPESKQREVMVSLGTSNRKDADRELPGKLAQIYAGFDAEEAVLLGQEVRPLVAWTREDAHLRMRSSMDPANVRDLRS